MSPSEPDLAAQVAALEAALADRDDRLSVLIAGLQVGVVVQGPASEILLFNPKALELLDMSEAQLVGRSSLDPTWNIVRDDGRDFPGPERPVLVAVRTRAPVRDVVMGVQQRTRDERRWLLVTAMPKLGPDGAVVEVVSTFTDITAHRRSEELVRAQARRIAELSTPLIPIDARTLVVPLLGEIDPQRAQRLLESLTEGVVARKARTIIVDVTGVPEIDADTVDALHRSAGAVRLLGARMLLSGVRPNVASAMVEHPGEHVPFEAHATLELAIAAARARR